jgi:two-component system sensor histidine kinase PilS (NtrC family)
MTADIRMLQDDERAALNHVKWLIVFRLAAVLTSLAVILVAEFQHGVFQKGLFPTYFVLVMACLANLTYLVLLRHVGRARVFATFQIYLDVLFASALIYLNGAGESSITFLYFACILAASTILGLWPGVAVASLAVTMLAGITIVTFVARHYGWTLPGVDPSRNRVQFTDMYSGVAFLMAQTSAYYLVAVLAGRLAQGMTGVRRLNEKILQSIHDGVLALDEDRHVISMNREAVRLLGLPGRTSCAGRPIDDVLDASGEGEVLKELFRVEHPGVSQVMLRTVEGRPVPVAVTSSGLFDEVGRRLGQVVMLIDLTERKRLEEALRRAETMEMVGQLAASIAHEIRNPLACIRGSVQELKSEAAFDEDSRRLMDLVVRESDRINTIITDFLQFSRMRRTALARCDLAAVLEDVRSMLESRSGQAVKIKLDAEDPLTCLGDVEQLKQVFLNLGINALDAMSSGGRLRISAAEESGIDGSDGSDEPGASRVVVHFEDTGVGMSEDVQRQLFEPFFTTKPRGTGLGLAIARRIIDAHRGRIEVASVLGKGSCFRVILQGVSVPQLQVSHG